MIAVRVAAAAAKVEGVIGGYAVYRLLRASPDPASRVVGEAALYDIKASS